MKQAGCTDAFVFSDLRQEPASTLLEVETITKQQFSGLVRKEEEILPALCAQNRLPLVIRDTYGQVVGYASMDKENKYIDEMGLTHWEDFGNVLLSSMDYDKLDSLVINFPEYAHEAVTRSLRLCARYQIVQPANFQILRFDRVVKAFMEAKCAYAPMLNGILSLDTQQFGKWSICCQDQSISVLPTDDPADLFLPVFDVYPFLFGPCHPALTVPSSTTLSQEKNALITNWFPLPLYCPNLS